MNIIHNIKERDMTKTEITSLLEDKQLSYTILEHPAAETIEEIDSFHLENADAIAKNLFLRDEKKRNYYLVVMRKDKEANLKELRAMIGSRPLSFASEEDLMRYMKLPKGSVTPFGILNDDDRKVRVIFDEDVVAYPLVGVHPNENTATVWLDPEDLIAILKEHGNDVEVVEIKAS